MTTAESVKVVVRCRPPNKREHSEGADNIITIDNTSGQCSIVNPGDLKAPPKTFTFDGAYGSGSTTESIYSEIVFPLVEVCYFETKAIFISIKHLFSECSRRI